MDLLDTVLAQFQTILATWSPDLILYGTRLMIGVAFLGGALVISRSAIAGTSGEFGSMMLELMFGFMKIALVYTVMAHIAEWGKAIIDTGQQIGTTISGQSPYSMTPAGIYGLGIALSQNLAKAHALSLWFFDPVSSVLTEVVIYLVIPVTWFCIAILYFMTILESLWVVAFGPIVVAFSAMELMFPMLIQWFWWLLSVAMKLIAIVLVLSMAQILARDWSAAPPNGLVILLEGLIIFYVAWKIPAMVAHMVSIRTGAMNMGEALMGAIAGSTTGAVTGAISEEAAVLGRAARNMTGVED